MIPTTHKGWMLVTEREDQDDVRKLSFIAEGPQGQRVHLDFSPYEEITHEAFAHAVDMGFPRRIGAGPWTNTAIINHGAAA